MRSRIDLRYNSRDQNASCDCENAIANDLGTKYLNWKYRTSSKVPKHALPTH